MLQLRPNCELCDVDLPPESLDARICTYECTFCASCVEHVLHDVCPNCGGGFAPRPIRPGVDRRPGLSRLHQPPASDRTHAKYTREEIAAFVGPIRDIAPEDR